MQNSWNNLGKIKINSDKNKHNFGEFVTRRGQQDFTELLEYIETDENIKVIRKKNRNNLKQEESENNTVKIMIDGIIYKRIQKYIKYT